MPSDFDTFVKKNQSLTAFLAIIALALIYINYMPKYLSDDWTTPLVVYGLGLSLLYSIAYRAGFLSSDRSSNVEELLAQARAATNSA